MNDLLKPVPADNKNKKTPAKSAVEFNIEPGMEEAQPKAKNR